MATPPITTASVQAVNYMDFSNPQVITMYILLALVIVLLAKRLYGTYKDITGMRVLEQDGGVLTITRIDNSAMVDKTLNVGERAYIIDHPAYRIATTLGVHLTLWIADKVTGRTIGLSNTLIKGALSASEQLEILRAKPEIELSTIREDKGITFLLLALGAGAFIGYALANFHGF